MAPLDEFFSEIEAQRWQLVALALALVVATLPVVWGLGFDHGTFDEGVGC